MPSRAGGGWGMCKTRACCVQTLPYPGHGGGGFVQFSYLGWMGGWGGEAQFSQVSTKESLENWALCAPSQSFASDVVWEMFLGSAPYHPPDGLGHPPADHRHPTTPHTSRAEEREQRRHHSSASQPDLEVCESVRKAAPQTERHGQEEQAARSESTVTQRVGEGL